MTRDQVSIRPVGDDEVDELARLHIAAFPESALSMLGSRVVGSYYRYRFDVAVRLLALGARSRDGLVGFLVAGTFSSGWRTFLRRHLLLVLVALARRPWVVLRRRFWSATETAAGLFIPWRSVSLPIEKGSVGVMAVGVAPPLRRSGVGMMLMEEAERRLRVDGVRWMHLSVRRDNTGARTFYEGLGWREAEAPRRATVFMVKRIAGPG